MIVDQDEIESLLAQAGDLRTEMEEELTKPSAGEATPAPEAAAAPGPSISALLAKASPEVRRILRVRVPVIVQLAARLMKVSKIRQLSAGATLEFNKSVDDPLSLYIRNRLIGEGQAVKSGEHFGLRVTDIGSCRKRIESLGGN
ncbi:MAG: FliM/FliN family flagellar motor switch protein [Phycisphaerae bacterium]|nr:FliM/FliN family flagellar motor switch protein [Phycisphaerae bacterium]